MREFPRYGSIDNLYTCPDILDNLVIVTEKIHGTNMRVMYDDTVSCCRVGGRRLELESNCDQRDGYRFWDYVNGLPFDTLQALRNYPGYVFYGEFFGYKIQKGVRYCNGRKREFRVFDIRGVDGNFLPHRDVLAICHIVGFNTVPVVAYGNVSQRWLERLLREESFVGLENGVEGNNNIIEGVVIKRADDSSIRAKFKSEKFKEKTNRPPVEKSPEQTNLEAEAASFAAQYVTRGRVSNVVEHITRDGNTEVSNKRTGDFLRSLAVDIWKEVEKPDKKTAREYNKAINNLGRKMFRDHLKEA